MFHIEFRKIIIMFKLIQKGLGAKTESEGLPNILYEEMNEYLVISEEAVSHIWLRNFHFFTV
jgi:hypothetical protein